MKGNIFSSYYSIFYLNQCHMSSLSLKAVDSLKNIANPEKIPPDFLKKLLWVAMDLKKTVLEKKKASLHLLDNKHVTLLFCKPHGRFQVSYTLACDLLGARKTLFYDPNFENSPSPANTGKGLSKLTDMFVLHGLHHDILSKITSTTAIPIFSASCNIYCLHKALSDLMTFLEVFHKLNGLTLAWVGPPNAIFNSYLVLCPKFGINIRYLCICLFGSGHMSPVHKFTKNNLFNKLKDSAKEFQTAQETVKGAHIIASAMHPEISNQINLELLKHADKNWHFMHPLPRSKKEVTDDVFMNEKNLSWITSENYLYVAMAIISMCLMNYEPKIAMPHFDGGSSDEATCSGEEGIKKKETST